MDLNTAMIMGTVASSAFGLGVYFSDKLNKVSEKFTAALTIHKEEDQEKFNDHSIRLSLLEIGKNGFTHSGKNPDLMDPKI